MPTLTTVLARILIAVLLGVAPSHATDGSTTTHAIAMHGTPALPINFDNLPYVNPDAPVGGTLTLGALGSFDSLNPFIVRGVAPSGLRGNVFESLMARSADEPFTLYGLIAQSIEVPADRSSITFNLHPKARFSDGRPITADDVAFSYELLRSKGRPYMRSHYSKVSKLEKLGPSQVRFSFDAAGDREIALIMGLMPILPKHAIDAETFDQTSLSAPIGSGPYVVQKIEPGHTLTYRRNPSYWARDLPIRRGLHNFETIRVRYFRDASALFEAFKTGAVHVRPERDPARWIDGYDFPAMRDGRVRRATFNTGLPAGMAALVFNTRRSKLADIRVRKALNLAFDSTAINKRLYHGRFVRSTSFFSRSELASTGRPATDGERSLLAPFPSAVAPDILAGEWRPPESGRDRGNRKNLRKAFGLLTEAGFRINDGRLIGQDGKQLELEFLVKSTAQERLVLAYAVTLRRLGIAVAVRRTEDSQFWSRLGKFDFDIIPWRYSASLSPGNEQINRWASSHATIERSLNYPGVQSPAADAMINAMLAATSRKDFVDAVRAFDRVLLSGHYVVPLFHVPEQWFAIWKDIQFPNRTPLFGANIAAWWHAAPSRREGSVSFER